MHGSVAHEGAGGHQLVLLVHVALADALAHVLAAQLVYSCGGAGGVRVPKRFFLKKGKMREIMLLKIQKSE